MITLLETLVWFMMYDTTRIEKMNKREFKQYCYDRDEKIKTMWGPCMALLDSLRRQRQIDQNHERNEP